MPVMFPNAILVNFHILQLNRKIFHAPRKYFLKKESFFLNNREISNHEKYKVLLHKIGKYPYNYFREIQDSNI